MNKNSFLRSIITGIIVVSVVGSAMHFVYELSGENYFVGLISPVNESTWEHMKLLYFPTLAYTMFLSRKFKDEYPNINCANSAGILIGTFSIPVIFYTYTGILGFHNLVLDIFTFIAAVILAFLTIYHVVQSSSSKKHCRLLSILVTILGFSFLIFTYYPPALGIFQSP